MVPSTAARPDAIINLTPVVNGFYQHIHKQTYTTSLRRVVIAMQLTNLTCSSLEQGSRLPANPTVHPPQVG